MDSLFPVYLSLVINYVLFQGTDAIRYIFLDMGEIKKVQLHADTFKEMCNLRIIDFNHWDYLNDCDCPTPSDSNVTFHTFLDSLPNTLKILRWDCFPQRSLPQDFCPENLVMLYMIFSDLEQLWEGDQVFHFKFMLCTFIFG
jgi:hypothetical protein